MVNGSWRRRPLPRDWPRIRARVLARDGYRCVQVLDDGRACPGTKLEVDHIREDGPDSMDNLQTLCHWHHAKKTHAHAQDQYAKRMKEVRSRFPRNNEHPGRIA